MLSRSVRFSLVLLLPASLLSDRPAATHDEVVGTGSVSVTPDGDDTWAQANSSGNQVTFTVKNTGGSADYFSMFCSKTGSVTGCTPSTWMVYLDPSEDTEVGVTYSTGSAGSGTVKLRAMGMDYGGEDYGHYDVTVTAEGVLVTPSNGTTPNRDPYTGGHEASFTVKNEGSSGKTFEFSCLASDGVSCPGTDKTSSYIGSGQQKTVKAYYNVTAPGDGTLKLIASNAQVADTGSYTVPVGGEYGVAVGRDGLDVMEERNKSGRKRQFYAKNTGNTTATYNLSCSRSGAVSSCSVYPTSAQLEAGVSRAVELTYATGSSSTGWVRLRAVKTGGGNVKDSAQVSVTTVQSPMPVVSLEDANPPLTRDLSQCVTIAIPGGAYECGDLRLGHALPSITTLGKTRTPYLTYNSRQAHPTRFLIAANVRRTGNQPDSVTAKLTINEETYATGKWSGSDWSTAGAVRRIALYYNGYYLTTGIYTHQLEVSMWYGANRYPTTASIDLAMVNRKWSPFGGGWWLAGLEQLFAQGDGSKLWVGGDGSTRHYKQVTTDVWASEHPAYPDTLKWNGSYYLRLLPHGDTVKFNSSGLHVKTVTRLEHETVFAYTSGRLTTITLPSQGGDSTYTFSYSGGYLTSVAAPKIGTTSRVTTVWMHSAKVDSIQDPDGERVRFTYAGSTRRVETRKDRNGSVATYSYNQGFMLWRSHLNLEPDSIRVSFAPTGSKGLPVYGSVDSTVYTAYHHPRYYTTGSNFADAHTRFYVYPSGSPWKIRNADGDWTYVTRADAQYSGLVTHIEYPNGWVQHAGYDDRGNIIVSTDSSTDATTHYTWDEKWNLVTSVVSPEGDRVDMAYSTSNGNRLWQQDTRGPASRVAFSYYTSGNKKGLLYKIDPPVTTYTWFDYDSMGNLKKQTSPMGYVTNFYKDGVGRDTLIVSPILPDTVQKQRIIYDIMDRVDTTVSIGPPMKYVGYQSQQYTVPAETLVVANDYDEETNLLEVKRRAYPDSNSVGWETSTFTYDRANRLLTEEHGPREKTFVYDPAGNVVQVTNDRGHTVTMSYDSLDRMKQRIVPAVTYEYTQSAGVEYGGDQNYEWDFPAYPNDGDDGLIILADTATFTYDEMSNMLTANNRYAHVRRTYYENGALETDSLRIRYYGGSSFTTHVYGLEYEYDLNGRRERLEHPSSLVPETGEDDQLYYYNNWGALEQVTSVQGYDYEYEYDLLGRQTKLTYPSGYETRQYDNEGRLTLRIEYVNSNRWHGDIFTYDRRGRIRTLNKSGYPDYWWQADLAYSGLGHLVWSGVQDDVSGLYTREEFRADALGRVYWRRVGGSLYSNPNEEETDNTYVDGRLVELETIEPDEPPAWWFPEHTFSIADADGNAEHGSKTREGSDGDPPSYPDWVNKEGSRSYYSADGKLMFRQVYRDSVQINSGVDFVRNRNGAFEEYWYDALGRRVLLRERGAGYWWSDYLCWDGGGNICKDGYERYVWDGDQILYEMRYSGANTKPRSGGSPTSQYGWIGYTHGLGIDAPLDATRMNYPPTDGDPVVLHRNWRGLHDGATLPNGTKLTENVGWPASQDSYMHVPEGVPMDWFGSVIGSNRDQSGLMYMRNRYYDPQTSQFTQQDPIGLAGGLNLYGFAGGDPINFGDPFGLRPLTDDERSDLGDMCDKIDCDRVQVYDGHDDEKTNELRERMLKLSSGRSIALGYHIVVGEGNIGDNGFVTGDALAHEMTHVAQFEAWGDLPYGVIGIATQIGNTVGNWLGGNDPAYQVSLPLNKAFGQYGMEQQAVIVQRCYQQIAGYCGGTGGSPFSFPGGR